MSLVVPWIGVPLVLGVLSAGCGLLLEQAAGTKISRALLLPAGFAVMVVVGVLTTTNGTTARLTIPAVLALAVTGFGLSLPWRRPRIDRWSAVAGIGVYAVFGAPVILSGRATFTGYITLDDTSTWLGMTDRLLTHGRNLTGLAPSSYSAALDWYWNQNGYPVGAFPPLGVAHVLLATDSAWLVQPYMAFAAGLLALTLYGMTGSLIGSRPLRALVAFIAAQPALLYGYTLWGGVKEVPATAMVALVAALVPVAVRKEAGVRSVIPLAVASAALVAILSFGGLVWIGPLLLPALVGGIRVVRGRAFARLATAFALCLLALSVPALISASGFLNNTSTILTKETEIGNLLHPLSVLQVLGIWPVGDFRLRPGNMRITDVLFVVEIAGAAAALVWAWRRRAWELPLYVGGTLVGCALAVAVGSPWVDAKALAIASPTVVLAGMAGAAWLFRGGRRVEAGIVAAFIAGGVLWSNALGYHDAWLAPRSQLRELEHIGKQFAGDGPALITEYQTFGVRHFLRNMDAEAPSELRERPILLLDGSELPKGQYADLDQFQLAGVLVYKTLVLPHHPLESRPPSSFAIAWKGKFYDVWQQSGTAGTRILEHLSLGTGSQATAIPRCTDVLRLARLAAQHGGTVAAPIRPPAVLIPLANASYPSTWLTYGSSEIYPAASGTLTATADVPSAGRYGIWLAGGFRRQLDVSLDGRRLFSGRQQLSHDGIEVALGSEDLQAGSHTFTLRYSPANLSPGSGGTPRELGPLVLSQVTDDTPVTYVQPTAARTLCGKSLDWVEAVAG